MPEEVLIITRAIPIPLPVQAMSQAIAKSTGGPVSMVCYQDYQASHDVLIKHVERAATTILYDPPFEPFFDKLSRTCPCRRIYSANYVLSYARSISEWHQKHGAPGWYETWSPLFSGQKDIAPVLIPPMKLEDQDPLNPLRVPGLRPELAVIMPPVMHEQARALQKEYLLDSDGDLSLVFLCPSRHIREMAERLAYYTCFHIPGFHEQTQWSFELSCLLCAGATITGQTPEELREFCHGASCLDEAISIAARARREPFRFREEISAIITDSFLRTLIED